MSLPPLDRPGPPRRRALIATLLGLTASACVSYHPSALPDDTMALLPPDMTIVSVDASHIDRPYLTPEGLDLSQPLTPNALAVLAVLENPDLKAQRAKLGVTYAQAFAARLLPDPSVQGSFDKILTGPDPFNGFGGQLALDLAQLRTARVTRESGDASKRQVRLDLAWSEWQTAGQARLQGVRILALQRQVLLARQSTALAEELLRNTSDAAGRGDISAAEVDTRRQSALDAADKQRATEASLVTARNELSKLLGLAPNTPIRLAAPPPSAIAPSADALVAQALVRRLDLQALRAGYAVAEADVHKAVLDQFPTLSLTVAGARDTASNYTVGPAVGFTLPLWNRNRGGIAVATATREQLKTEYVARLFQTRADITTAVAGLATVRGQQAALLAKMPEITRFAEASRRAAARGDLAPAVAATATQALRDRNLTLSQLDQQIAEETIALELLSGGPSEGWPR